MSVTSLKAASLNVDFNTDLESLLPRLRVYALSLTRNADRAEDLVQQTALKALSGRGSFRAGSNFAAWMFRIQRNEFISELRRTRPTVEIDSPAAQAASSPPVQESGLVFSEFMTAFRQVPHRRREALLMATVEGLSYDEIAKHTGVAVGAVKSRVWRGRDRLKQLLDSPRETGAVSPEARRAIASAAH
jgi:RNA polymerase sigma-70 factor (ECF subfamily)